MTRGVLHEQGYLGWVSVWRGAVSNSRRTAGYRHLSVPQLSQGFRRGDRAVVERECR
jgi:hypothetical protein